jgi:hypothetical protein
MDELGRKYVEARDDGIALTEIQPDKPDSSLRKGKSAQVAPMREILRMSLLREIQETASSLL